MLCNVKMLVAFEDLNGELIRYSTHGIYDAEEYFKEAWTSCEKSFTANDYPDFFKVKQYKKVLERREKQKVKTEDSQNGVEESEEEYQRVPLKDSKTTREKTVYKPQSTRSSAKVRIALKISSAKATAEEEAAKTTQAAIEQQATVQNRVKIQLPKAPVNETKNELSENIFRTPQLLGLAEKPSPNLANLGNPELAFDMRSPGFTFFNEQFMKPTMINPRLQPFREDFGSSPPFTANTFLNETPDGFSAPKNRKGSFENYFQYLDDTNNMWSKFDAANGLKLRSSQYPMMTPHGIGDFLNYNYNGATGFPPPQRDLPPFVLDNSYAESMRFNPNNSEFGDLRGSEPNKKVKKD